MHMSGVTVSTDVVVIRRVDEEDCLRAPRIPTNYQKTKPKTKKTLRRKT